MGFFATYISNVINAIIFTLIMALHSDLFRLLRSDLFSFFIISITSLWLRNVHMAILIIHSNFRVVGCCCS